MKQIAIITVAYNNYTVFDDLFASFAKQTDTSYHMYVADASSDKQPISYDIPHTVIPIENKGYAHGVNAGLEKAIQDGYTLFCVINDDVYFNKDFVRSINGAFKKNPHTLFGGKIYYAAGYEYHKNRYKKQDKGM